MATAAQRVILRIEIWHAVLLGIGLLALVPADLVEPWAMLFGGLFIGVNFLLLAFGVFWILTPLAGRGNIKTGIALLVTKVIVFLGLLSLVFFKFGFDAISFAVGFSTLFLAIIIEGLRTGMSLGT